MKYDVVLLTDERYVNPTSTNEYVDNILLEDKLVAGALTNKGLSVKKVAWSDHTFDWETASYALFRTTWDYAERFREFSDWLLKVSVQTRLINSYELISWNLDKHYLDDLALDGINTVETYFVQPKDERSLTEIHDDLGWDHTVLKPAISAAAKDTFELTSSNIMQHEDHYRSLIANEAILIQPFQKSVMDQGEMSLMVIGGEYTHAVKKKAKPGDFRVQDDFGGTVEEYKPTSEEIKLALKAVEASPEMPIYARIDMLIDNSGDPAISELELIEPELWFRNNRSAAEKLAESIFDKINNH